MGGEESCAFYLLHNRLLDGGKKKLCFFMLRPLHFPVVSISQLSYLILSIVDAVFPSIFFCFCGDREGIRLHELVAPGLRSVKENRMKKMTWPPALSSFFFTFFYLFFYFSYETFSCKDLLYTVGRCF